MISFRHKGSFNKVDRFLAKASNLDKFRHILERYAQQGVQALADATPQRTGQTAESWSYEIEVYKDRSRISWTNSNTVNGLPVVILLQHGHATTGGTYIQGIDFINPAIGPIIQKIADDAWKEVKSL